MARRHHTIPGRVHTDSAVVRVRTPRGQIRRRDEVPHEGQIGGVAFVSTAGTANGSG